MADIKFEYVRQENKTQTFNFRLKKSTRDRLDELVAQKQIRSISDLINKLLEDYLDEVEKTKNEESGTP